MCDWEQWKLGIHQPEELTARWDDKKASITSVKPIEERWEALPSVREEGAAVNPCKHASLMVASEGKTSTRVYWQQQRLLLRFQQNLHVCRHNTTLTNPVGGSNESRSYFAKEKKKITFFWNLFHI